MSFAISFFSKVRMRSKRSGLEASKGEECLFMWNDMLQEEALQAATNADSSEKISDLLSASFNTRLEKVYFFLGIKLPF